MRNQVKMTTTHDSSSELLRARLRQAHWSAVPLTERNASSRTFVARESGEVARKASGKLGGEGVDNGDASANGV